MKDLYSTVFYKARFQIESQNESFDLLEYLVQKIKYWLVNKHNSNIFWNWEQYKRFGNFVSSDKTVFANSTSFIPSPDERYWATIISELQKKEPFAPRTWHTEVGFEQTDSMKATISYVLYYNDAAGFIGEFDSKPESNIPKLIRWLLNDNKINCKINNSKLNDSPKELKIGDFPNFYKLLKDSNRNIPIVFIAPTKVENSQIIQPIISPFILHNDNLMGNANVFYSSHLEFLDEMRYFIDYKYNCPEGTIRIYMPKLDPSDEKDCYRHRFISKEEIDGIGAEKVIAILRRALSQDIRYYDEKYMFRVENCNNLYARSRFYTLKSSSQENKEWIKLVEKELQEKEEQSYSLKKKNEFLTSYQNELINQNSNLQNDLLKLQNSAKFAQDKQFECETKIRDLQKSQSYLYNLKTYPKGPKAIAEYFESVYPNSLAFTDRGRRSLSSCITRDDILWECLFYISTVLHELYEKSCADIVKEYKKLTNWQLARGEGSQTRADKEYMSQRKDVYSGKSISIEPHVKRGNRDSVDSIRVYFAYDSEYNKIIIGHCGTHLDNYSTQKM